MSKQLTTRALKRKLAREIGKKLTRFAALNEELKEVTTDEGSQTPAEKSKIKYAVGLMAEIRLLNNDLNRFRKNQQVEVQSTAISQEEV